MAECEGLLISLDDQGVLQVEELRVGPAQAG